MQCVSRRLAAGDAAGSGAGGHEGGEDVVRVAVQVLAGSVVAHCGAGVGMTGGDLDIAQVDACVEHVVTKLWRSMCVCRLLREPSPGVASETGGKQIAAYEWLWM